MIGYAYVYGLAALATTFVGFAAAEPSIAVAYCATFNTASTSANSSIYQSEGLCYDFCNDDGYALGVLQDSNCWCTDYVPGGTVDTSECESSCPGYPDDYCGGSGTYGYIQLSAEVSGTKGGTSSTASSTATSTATSTSTSSSDDLVTITQSPSQATVTVTETPVQTSVTTSSSSASDSSTASTTSLTSEKSSESAEKTSTSDEPTTTAAPESTTSSSHSPSIVTSVQTVTSNGQVIYQTITSTAEASAATGNGGLSGGAVAAIVIAILLILALFIVGALLYRRHRRRRESMEGTPLAGGMAHRRGSSAGIMSKTGTISSSGYGGMPMEEDIYGSHRMSMKPMDPRLDPKQTFGLYRAASHDSINTLRDDHDYSRRVHQPGRVLRVTNMDPTDNP